MKFFCLIKLGLIAFLGGLMMGLTPSPTGLYPLAWIAITPLWVVLYKNKLPGKYTFFLGLIWGAGYHGLALFWITGIHPMTWLGVSWIASFLIAFFCWLFITFWGASLVALWSLLLALITASIAKAKPTNKYWEFLIPLLRIFFGTALWCGLEFFWSQGALWWSSLAYTQSPHNLIILQLSQSSGPTTIIAAIVAVNGLIGEALISYSKKIKLNYKIGNCLNTIALLLLISLHLVGWKIYNLPLIDSEKQAIEIGIVQGNIPNEIKLYSSGLRRALFGYQKGYENLAKQGVKAVLTPEGAIPFFPLQLMNSSLITSVQQQKVVAWIGAFNKQEKGYTNSLFTINSKGNIFSRYDKANLVPIGEYIPFEPLLGGIIQRLSPLDEHQLAGNSDQVFNTPFGRAIVGICYDSAFSRHFQQQAKQGGEFILTASNNAHYSAAMPAQHHAQDVMRSIETNRWAVRATNTGYSAIVDPKGRTRWQSALNKYELHAHTIYRRTNQTLYVRRGDWLLWVLIGSGLILWLILRFGLYPSI